MCELLTMAQGTLCGLAPMSPPVPFLTSSRDPRSCLHWISPCSPDFILSPHRVWVLAENHSLQGAPSPPPHEWLLCPHTAPTFLWSLSLNHARRSECGFGVCLSLRLRPPRIDSLILCTTILFSKEHRAGADWLNETDPLPFTVLPVCARYLALPFASILSVEPHNDPMRWRI